MSIQRIKLNQYPIIVPKKKTYIKTPPNEFQLHGIFIVGGRRNTGKSTCVSSKLKHLQKEGFADRIFLISPTSVSNEEVWSGLIDNKDIFPEAVNEDVIEVERRIQEEMDDWEQYLYDLKLYDRFVKAIKSKRPIEEHDPDFLYECAEAGFFNGLSLLDASSLASVKPVSKYGHRPVCHLILDDCQSTELFQPSKKNRFLNFAIKHRHVAGGLGCSVWILIQNYSAMTGLPKSIRDNGTVLIIFKMKDEGVLHKIYTECAGEVTEEDFYTVYNYCCKNRDDSEHSFMCIEFDPKKPYMMFRRKFDEFIIPKSLRIASGADSNTETKG